MHRELSCLVLWLAVTGAAVVAGEPPAAIESSAPVLQIHLPREVTVQDSSLRLDQVTVVKGDPALVAAAGTLGMGRLSVPGQRVVLDRVTIVSRLASCGISADDVRLTGAERVVIRRDQKTIDAEDFLDVGRTFLRQHPPGPMVSDVVPTIRPKDLILPGQVDDLQVTPRFVRNGARGYVSVQIVVAADGKEIAIREIPFRLRYQYRRAVTAKPVAEGVVFTPENVTIKVEDSDRPEAGNWQPPYGLIAQRALPENAEITSDMIGSVPSAAVVRRNETVLIRLERPGLLVTAMGTALQEARAGEFLKVRNTDSHRIIVCKVNDDGTVEPML
jgi:flagella basal body P-ring formation protein FlgA